QPITASSSASELTHARVVDPPRRSEGAESRVRAKVPLPDGGSALFLDKAGVSRLTPAVRETLANLDLDLGATTLPSVLHTLKLELGNTASLLGTPSKLGGALAHFGPWNPLTEPPAHDDASDPKPAVLLGPPVTHGQVKPAGNADLLVVRQHVLGYAAGEVA